MQAITEIIYIITTVTYKRKMVVRFAPVVTETLSKVFGKS